MAMHVGVFVYVRVLHSMLCAVGVIGSYHGFDGGWSCDHFSLQPPHACPRSLASHLRPPYSATASQFRVFKALRFIARIHWGVLSMPRDGL